MSLAEYNGSKCGLDSPAMDDVAGRESGMGPTCCVIGICSQSAPLFSAKQDEGKRREGGKIRKMEKKVVNVTEP